MVVLIIFLLILQTVINGSVLGNIKLCTGSLLVAGAC